ncbi:hypothetical protein AUC69_13515 [Methyloceanibacter superfactus]|uniref:DNA polymerase Y-family little finger domain-containing protein n=1 Tax=Methyloceanibacter superfactus TaxID=1774969 RepID=A0A1E3VSX6_9HYPH|nr:hypothetical protein [Methyloceanibacter superfactus]ODR96629.1 hypothetical protein AUC69_13515 [Methyloceanibacter superfactus]
MRRLGLKRVGQLIEVPRASLERRFHSRDMAQAVLHRLDQALGQRAETLKPLLPASDFVARLAFPEPLITHDGVIAGLGYLAGELGRILARANLGARRVALWVARTDGSATEIAAGLSAPSHAAAHLVRLLQDKLEDIDMGFGVDLMALAALITEPLHPTQTSLTETGEILAPEILIDALANRLGIRAVRRLFPRSSYIPERAQSTRGAFAGVPIWPHEASAKPPRPLCLLSRPEPVTVLAEIPEGPPARFTWRRVSRRVVKAQGPERIAPEWWRALNLLAGTSLRTRDYYRLEDEDGCRYWVFREGLYGDGEDEAPDWFLHGVFA